jgi:hypothetical protein
MLLPLPLWALLGLPGLHSREALTIETRRFVGAALGLAWLLDVASKVLSGVAGSAIVLAVSLVALATVVVLNRRYS